MIARRIAVLFLALVLAGCTASSGPTPSDVAGTPGSGGSSGPSASPAVTVSPLTLTTDDAGLSLTARFDRTTVAPGAIVTVVVTVHNGRTTSVVGHQAYCNAPVTMALQLPVPLVPGGRSWTGELGDLKRYIVDEGHGGSGPASSPEQVVVPDLPCTGAAIGDRVLAPGATLTSTISWAAEITKGAPALPGAVPFTILFSHDSPSATTVPPTVSGGVMGSTVALAVPLVVSGTLAIVGPPPKLLSLGQAIDVVLADRGFDTWLTTAPESSWSIADVALANLPATSVQPGGPSWAIELFRDPRSFASAYVDPHSGALRSIDYCNVPCSR